MKKSVILMLIAVYVLSICAVGFFGIKVEVLNPTIYPSSITIDYVRNGLTEEKIDKISDTEWCVNKTNYKVGANGLDLHIMYTVGPANATDKTVTLMANGASATLENDIVHFSKNGTAVITFISNGKTLGKLTINVDEPLNPDW